MYEINFRGQHETLEILKSLQKEIDAWTISHHVARMDLYIQEVQVPKGMGHG